MKIFTSVQVKNVIYKAIKHKKSIEYNFRFQFLLNLNKNVHTFPNTVQFNKVFFESNLYQIIEICFIKANIKVQNHMNSFECTFFLLLSLVT